MYVPFWSKNDMVTFFQYTYSYVRTKIKSKRITFILKTGIPSDVNDKAYWKISRFLLIFNLYAFISKSLEYQFSGVMQYCAIYRSQNEQN